VTVELDDEFDDEPRSTRYLIERQRASLRAPLIDCARWFWALHWVIA
jgi:hypothetical protein